MNKTMEDMIKIKIINKKTAPKQAGDDLVIKKIPPTNNKSYRKGKSRPRYILWFIAFISFIFLFSAISYLFSKATVVIEPKIKAITIDENFLANKDPSSSAVPFDMVVISGEESRNLEVVNKKEVEYNAKGVVILYNAFSSKPQTLVIDTRLEGSNGKIYKTEQKVIVPGISSDGTPGQVEVNIYGSEAGEEYNSTPLDFKILGFKGSSKYDKFYARSKGDITGGAKGELYIIPDEEKEQIIDTLESSLKKKLLNKVKEQTPLGFVLFNDAVFLDITERNFDSFSETSFIPVSIKGTLHGFLFDEKKLTQKIIQNTLKDYDGSDMYIHNIEELSFTLLNKENISFNNLQSMNFTLQGLSSLVWKFDQEDLIVSLLNEKKKDFDSISLKYPNIISANFSIRPFWRRSFPDKAENIEVIINYPQ